MRVWEVKPGTILFDVCPGTAIARARDRAEVFPLLFRNLISGRKEREGGGFPVLFGNLNCGRKKKGGGKPQ